MSADWDDPDVVRIEDTARARLESWRILVPSCLLAPFLGYLVFVVLRRGPEIWELLFVAALIVAGLSAAANYLWLDYLLV